ncbi:hypothetical protein ACFLZ1_02185 [Patescibacteria group bacterium]
MERNNIKLNSSNNHNIFHFTVVLFAKLLNLIVFIPISVYMLILGYIFSKIIFQTYLPLNLFEKINNLSYQLPFVFELEILITKTLGKWFTSAPMWWAVVVGLPLILGSVSIFFIALTDFVYAITNTAFNRIHCFFHRKPKSKN